MLQDKFKAIILNLVIFVTKNKAWAVPVGDSSGKVQNELNRALYSIVSEVGNYTITENQTKMKTHELEYTPAPFELPKIENPTITPQTWGGNCTLSNWNDCKQLATWFGKYEDPKDGKIKEYLLDCKDEPVICLKNSWTVTRCNLLCMSRCNREIQYKYDKYVKHKGECKAHSQT